MKTFLLVLVALFFVNYVYDAEKNIRNEKKWTKEYNKIYSTKNPDKVAVINDYYNCLSSSESAIEGCDVHVAKSKVDTATIHAYLNGVDEYIKNKKKDD